MTGTEPSPSTPKPLWRRLWPVALLLLGLLVAYLSGLLDYLSFASLQQHHQDLTQFVANNFILSLLIFAVLYTVVVAFSLPGALFCTLTGGFLFGTLVGTIVVVFSATLGACLLFLAAQTAVGESLKRRAGPALTRLQAGFRENEVSYLLVLRLVPLFPFFVVNLAAALLNVPLRTFAWTTALGIIPGTLAFAQAGTGLGSILAQGGEFSFSGILTGDVIAALLGLAVLSLLPVLYKAIQARKARRARHG